MQQITRRAALSLAAFCLALGLSAVPALAKDDNNDVVRDAQIRLADLGYPVGNLDGVMGRMTENALMDFQRMHGLPITGRLTPETFALLTRAAERGTGVALYKNGRDSFHIIDDNPQVITIASGTWSDQWHAIRSEELPLRFAHLNVREEDAGNLRHYTVTLNGQPVLFANNQPGVLRASATYSLAHEDAVIFTAYQADAACPNRSYLLVVHSDGSYNQPSQIGDCSGNYQAHVSDNMLLISFPTMNLAEGWNAWDTWIYRNNMIVRG